MTKKRINSILSENSDKNFVDRILNRERFGAIRNKDGSFSTHSMAWGEVDGDKFIVFPTVVQLKGPTIGKSGTLKRLDDRSAVEFAIKNNEFILFDNAADASRFSEQYKKVWE